MNLVVDVKTHYEYSCGSDHDCVVMSMKLQIEPRVRGVPIARSVPINRDLVQSNKEEVSQKLARGLNEILPGWSNTELLMKESIAPYKFSSFTPLHKRWLTEHLDELSQLLSTRDKCYEIYIGSRTQQNYETWKRSRLNVTRSVRTWKRQRITVLSRNLSNLSSSLNFRKSEVCRELRLLGGEKPARTTLLTLRDSIPREIVLEHFQRVFSQVEGTDVLTSNPPQILPPLFQENLDYSPSEIEIALAVNQLKGKKAPGLNGLFGEVFKYGQQSLVSKLAADFAIIWGGDSQNFPPSWKVAKVVLVYKGKGSRSDPNNYRGIFLLDVAGKIMARVIANRLQVIYELYADPWQFGFRSNRGTQQAAHILNKIQEEGRYRNRRVFVAFVDLENAFDSVNRCALWSALETFQVPQNIIRIVKYFHENFQGILDDDSSFIMHRGVRQGCVMGPILFNMVFDLVIKKAIATGLGGGVEFVDESGNTFFVNKLAYADDLALVDTSIDSLEKNLRVFDNTFKEFGLKINYNKTKIMCLTEKNTFREITCNDHVIDWVDEYCYLGSIFSVRGDCETDLRSRLRQSDSRLMFFKALLSNAAISAAVKRRLIETCILPVLYFGADHWATTERHVAMLRAFHNKCSRIVLNVSKFEHRSANTMDIGLSDARSILAKRRSKYALSQMFGRGIPTVCRVISSRLNSDEKVGTKSKTLLKPRIHLDLEWIFETEERIEICLNTVESSARTSTKAGHSRHITKLLNDALAIKQSNVTPKLLHQRSLRFPCSEEGCVKSFAEAKELYRHIRNSHASDEVEVVPGKIKCPLCQNQYKTQGWLNRHLTLAHNLNMNPIVILNDISERVRNLNTNLDSRGVTTSADTVICAGVRNYRLGNLTLKGSFRCPFPSCRKVTNSAKGMYNHGVRDHGWSFVAGGPPRARGPNRRS